MVLNNISDIRAELERLYDRLDLAVLSEDYNEVEHIDREIENLESALGYNEYDESVNTRIRSFDDGDW